MRQILILGEEIHWPALCACCLKPPTGTVAQTGSRTQNYLVVKTTSTLELAVPYCDECARHVRWNEGTPVWVTAFVLFLVSGLLGLLLGIYLLILDSPLSAVGYVALASPFLVTAYYVRRKLSERPSALGEEHASPRAAVHVGYFEKGQTRLLVLNDEFADALAALNNVEPALKDGR